jgi:hypothetical protein
MMLVAILLLRFAEAEATSLHTVVLGRSAVALNGPWKFHTGDDRGWANADFDDSNWESVDLTPPPGAHDSDVGLTGYVPGWQARGHRGYLGFGWYRTRVAVQAPDGETLALSGPPLVDSAYQVFFNGRLLGEFGDFSGPTPTAYGIHRPKFFALLPSEVSALEQANCCVIAFRVWMGPWALRDPESGGIHIAPSLGTGVGAYARYQAQWWETIRGYAVDAVEGVIFVLLALMTLTLIPFDRPNPAYRWLAIALVFIGIARTNQAVLFCWEIESIHGFEWVTLVLMVPLSLGAWTMGWYYWVRPRNSAWLPYLIGALTPTLMVIEILRRSWFYGVFPPALDSTLRYCSMTVRLIFLLLTGFMIFRTSSQRDREKWLTVLAMLSISVGLFAQELSLAHVPGIWFPFGIGVSRTEYAYAVFDIALVALLLSRLYSFRVDRQGPEVTAVKVS